MMETAADNLTLEQYALSEEVDEHWVTELVRGVLVREPRPGAPHGAIQVRLGRHLATWGEAHGGVVTAESGYILSDDPPTLRGPDLAVVLDGRSGAGEVGDWIRGAPDVAVEILSSSDTSTGIQAKTLDYLESGSRQVWIVDPAARTVTIYRSDGSAQLLRETDVLDGEDVLTGFSLPLDELFAQSD